MFSFEACQNFFLPQQNINQLKDENKQKFYLIRLSLRRREILIWDLHFISGIYVSWVTRQHETTFHFTFPSFFLVYFFVFFVFSLLLLLYFFFWFKWPRVTNNENFSWSFHLASLSNPKVAKGVFMALTMNVGEYFILLIDLNL